jgi:hypothetical protein
MKTHCFQPNPYHIDGMGVHLHIVDKYNNKFNEILLDKQDYDKIKKYRWRLNKTDLRVFISNSNKYTDRTLLQQTLVKYVNGYYVAFRNNNKLDFRRKNLMLLPIGVNPQNFKPHHIKQPKFLSNLDSLDLDDCTPNKLKPSRLKILGDKVKVQLLNRQSEQVGCTYVSIEDLNIVKGYRWSLATRGYAYNPKLGFLHQLVLPVKSGYVVDHRNQNKLDNTRNNLRSVTISHNSKNIKSRSNTGIAGITDLSIGKTRGYRLRFQTSNGQLIELRPKTLMAAICIKNYLIDKYGDDINEKLDVEYYAKQLKCKPIKITSYADISANCFFLQETKLGIYGLFISNKRGTKQYITCGFNVKWSNLKYIKICSGRDDPLLRVKSAYLYNKAVTAIMDKFPLFYPLNNMKEVCKKYKITKQEFIKHKDSWKLSESLIDAIQNMKYSKKQSYDVISFRGNKVVKMYCTKGFFIFDYKDLKQAFAFKWQLRDGNYVISNKDAIRFHRYILNMTMKDRHVVNHKDSITWNNCRYNLEKVTQNYNASVGKPKHITAKVEKKLIKEINNCEVIKQCVV